MEIVKIYLVHHPIHKACKLLRLSNGKYMLDTPGNSFIPAMINPVPLDEAKTLIENGKLYYEN